MLSLKKHRALLGDIDDQTLYDLLTQLQGKGWLLRIEQGTYVVVPRAARRTWHEHPFIIAAAMAPDPYYISYWSALSFHNLTTQMPPLVSKGWRKQDLYTSIRAKEADWDSALRVLVAEPPSFDEALDVVERALRPIVGKVRE